MKIEKEIKVSAGNKSKKEVLNIIFNASFF